MHLCLKCEVFDTNTLAVIDVNMTKIEQTWLPNNDYTGYCLNY